MIKTNYMLQISDFDCDLIQSYPEYGFVFENNKHYFRFIEKNTAENLKSPEDSNITTEYGQGFLTKNWVSNITNLVDISKGGSYMSSGSTRFVFGNVKGIYDFIKTNNIDLQNATIKVFEYTNTDVVKTWFIGKVTNIKTKQTQIELTCKHISDYRNNVIISKQADGNKDVYYPVIFGDSKLSKFPISKDVVMRYNIDYRYFQHPDCGEGLPFVMLVKYATNAQEPSIPEEDEGLFFICQSNIVLTVGQEDNIKEAGNNGYLYVHAVKGDGENILRKVKSIPFAAGDTIHIELENSVDIDSNDLPVWTADGTLLTFYYIDFAYIIDKWEECGGFTDGKYYFKKDENFIIGNNLDSFIYNNPEIKLNGSTLVKKNEIGNSNLTIPEKILFGADAGDITDFETISGTLHYDTLGKYWVETEFYDKIHTITTYNDDSLKLLTDGKISFGGNLDRPVIDIEPAMTLGSFFFLFKLENIQSEDNIKRFLLNGYIKRPVDSVIIYKFKIYAKDSFGTYLLAETNNGTNQNFSEFAYVNIPSQYVLDPQNIRTEYSGGKQYYFTFKEYIDSPNKYHLYGKDLLLLDDSIFTLDYKNLDLYVVINVVVSRVGATVSDTLNLEEFEFALQSDSSNSNLKDGLYADFTGRKSMTTEIADSEDDILTNGNDIYNHLCRLEMYEGRVAPVKGWGQEYIADYTSLIDNTSNYGGMKYENWNIPVLRGELIDYNDLSVIAAKNLVLKDMWAMGSIGFTGEEKLYPLENIFSSDVDNLRKDIVYSDIIDIVIEINKLDKKNIITEPYIEYDFYGGQDKGNKKIAITNSDAQMFDPSYVIGVNDDLTKERLWNFANNLYKKYKVKNAPNKEFTKCKFIYKYADALSFIEKWFFFQGVDDFYNVKERYTTDFTIPLSILKNLQLEIGTLIKLNIGSFLIDIRGIITGINIDLQNQKAKITAFISAEDEFGGFIKTEDNSYILTEDGFKIKLQGA